MKHPSQDILALHAGGDLGWLAGWRTARHVAGCERCAGDVEAFSELREAMPELNQLPGIQWNRLAAEMQANIRLGLAAGQCVREVLPAPRLEQAWFRGARAAVALAGIVALVATGVVLEGPAPQVAKRNEASFLEPVVQTTAHGIQRRSGDQGFALMNVGAQRITYTVSAKGSVGARYMDPETDQVTMTKVYVE
ncbi:MAG: hypothetical protein ABI759_29760 [Candidatus Solibacter sp.]